MIRKSTFILLALAVCSIAPAEQAGEPFKPGKLPADVVEALRPGLTLRFYARPGDAQGLDARRVRLAALHVPKNSAASPFLAPGPVHARITGYLKNPLKGDFRFRLAGTGTMSLRINGKEVLTGAGKEAEVTLAKNYNRIDIVYDGPANGDATLRVEWAGEKFGFEPLPPDSLSSRKDDADLVAQSTLREGRQLFAERHCASCHAMPGKVAEKDCRMPELSSKAPQLDVNLRLQPAWIAAWILDPRALRPEATMPKVLHGLDSHQRAADIAAYLTSVKQAEVPAKTEPKAEDGQAIFQKLGCVTCHRFSDPKTDDELGRLSLYHVGAKYTETGLRSFLKNPHERYAWIKMPDFRLSDDEVAKLQAYLRTQAKGTLEVDRKGNAENGAKWFKESCSACHSLAGKSAPNTPPVAMKSVDKGCLMVAIGGRGSAPDFGLQPEQRSALAAFLKTDGSSLTRETPAEFSLRQVKSLRCDSCHRRDGEVTRWHAVLEDEGKVPENLPSLTWVGEKLKPAWTKKLFHGEVDQRARPWLKARMPAFPARADLLAVGLSHEHGFGINDDERPKPDPKLAAIGEKLIPQQGGFNCINCHGIGKQKAIQPFEAPGINLTDAAIRLRYTYYQRWMLAPDRVDVTMRMPVFATDGKTTQLRDVFDGDARKQYDALWQYIQSLPAKK
ncbi:MAG TPA: c-type cytochrome [Gemmataceae bacterium]|nr:c-type cytochrome [Gemmataceae bacterium]